MAGPNTDAGGDQKQDYHLEWPNLLSNLFDYPLPSPSPKLQGGIGYLIIWHLTATYITVGHLTKITENSVN